MVLYFLAARGLKKIEGREFTLRLQKNSQDSVEVTDASRIPTSCRELACRKQPFADHEHQCQRDFRHQQDLRQNSAPIPRRPCVLTIFDVVVQVPCRGLERGHQSYE
jgi:hypothetical protein